ncbi:glutaminyl-tRNA synthase (glutamine-hydrolyzing) subunit B [Candidatus Kaiserbacteria bacterium RIFCSPHIGHO2_01_FULL_50_13]|uniref:Aspartyl/glutamyl-tRNA(Asn/Gln) amidotransferase subunit B n=1 Tax=Candidatus Kaiserbacteria bacterium RIFCSPLOWO2_01_FULL_50_24 TaxID=1798507 RepID=A0A1F6EI76_9BACT|nr:MAG: glutaminyl-tRNA synthase (glutamine-hydrolyzing) subunit B [Candidatus Kaiserbacteria bacterium RIFCSPHIGHO2_01_FULL_50_13]OGG73366.1 MAG: glutaminyl-tRNA synthase (glutamine-hydrolyzing) subunit B [Candidatus Kaiserbacteria bacterium RIFCSPLOWO2_01_FULL_50_24]OGG80882.1 MAG: glutaminyl-tRNA synthase (glutamine-hydrolyzing) subunit B [Candidatus Kaiserbacteria bacterium RIFCSPLOWO2_02_FULL_51_13]
MSNYVPTIGLEIHAELKTRTKMFCDSKNDPDEKRPNVNICPVCLAHPGTLPVVNREAVKHVLRVGAALGGKLADYTEFDRKNYFYPDLPKGYQLSQYEYPLVSGGELNNVALTRVHLEEDTASSLHDDATGATLIDYNRAGVPLMELVTEPVITSAKQAGDFARELQLLLRYLGASEANMEKGEMRVEANVSVRFDKSQIPNPKSQTNHKSQTNSNDQNSKLGTKVEIKNLNSFRAMERAVAYEIKRQTELLERGESVVQETRGWDDAKQKTFTQRMKEGSADYRYFPDPDLPSLKLSEMPDFAPEELRRAMPELPWVRRGRYTKLGVKTEDAALFTSDSRYGDFFDIVSAEFEGGKLTALAANYLANDVVRIIRDIEEREAKYRPEIPISTRSFKEIIHMVGDKEISSRVAKDLLLRAVTDARSPREIAIEEGILGAVSQEDISAIVDTVLEQNRGVAEDYRAGKAAALQYLVGQGMKAAKGAADPEALREAIQKRLS